MKVQVLIENRAGANEALCHEHGLSLYVEWQGLKILFDAGLSEAFAGNAAALGVDLTAVDFAVLSHGHIDHGGGLMKFLSLNDHAPVYASRHVFGPHYNASGKYIGLGQALAESGRLILLEEDCEPVPGVHLLCGEHMPMRYPVQTYGLHRREGKHTEPEDFRHEICMRLKGDGTDVLFSGCSHRGILNIMAVCSPEVLIGGFHFMREDVTTETGRTRLTAAARELLGYDTQYYTGHCTGAEQEAFLQELMGDRLRSLRTGDVVELQDSLK